MYKIFVFSLLLILSSNAEAGREDRVFFGKNKGKEVLSYDEKITNLSKQQLQADQKIIQLLERNNQLLERLSNQIQADSKSRQANDGEVIKLLNGREKDEKKKSSRGNRGFRE